MKPMAVSSHGAIQTPNAGSAMPMMTDHNPISHIISLKCVSRFSPSPQTSFQDSTTSSAIAHYMPLRDGALLLWHLWLRMAKGHLYKGFCWCMEIIVSSHILRSLATDRL